MRLIDADELIEIAKQDGAYDYVSAEEIANAPTIDICKDCDCRRAAIEALEQEPRKGKWIVYEMHTTTYGKVGFECSACGVPYKLEHRLGADVGWHYCPTCGAKMRGDKE